MQPRPGIRVLEKAKKGCPRLSDASGCLCIICLKRLIHRAPQELQ
jgi:hypothetical protein